MAKIMLNDAISQNCCTIAQPMTGASSKRSPVRALARLNRVSLEEPLASGVAGLLMNECVCSLVQSDLGQVVGQSLGAGLC